MRRVHAPLIQVPGIKAFATVLQCVHSLGGSHRLEGISSQMSGRAESRQVRQEGPSEVWRMVVSAPAARTLLA